MKYENLTISQWKRVMKAQTSDVEPMEKAFELLGIITGQPVEHFESIPFQELPAELEKLKFLNEPMQRTPGCKDSYMIAGRLFWLNKELHNLSAGQYIDLINLLATDKVENIHKIMAVVLIPAKKQKTFFGERTVPEKYNRVSVFEVADYLHNNMEVGDALSVMDFFLSWYNGLVTNIVTSSERMILKAIAVKMWQKMTFRKGGDGLLQLIQLRRQLMTHGKVLRKNPLQSS